MTFEEFQASGRDVPDLQEFCGDLFDGPKPGRVYTDLHFYIEREPDGRWSLLIENQDWLGEPLEVLERHLYDYACASGAFE